jgi:hypothetical protein
MSRRMRQTIVLALFLALLASCGGAPSCPSAGGGGAVEPTTGGVIVDVIECGGTER